MLTDNNFVPLEILIANSYNFQNTDEIKKNFKTLFGVDIKIDTNIMQIIKDRHNLVHRFIHTKIYKKDMVMYIDAILKMIDSTISEIESKYKIRVDV